MPQDGDAARNLWQQAGMGLEFASSVIGAAAVGWLLDTYAFGTFPWLTVVGAVLGLIAGMYTLIRHAMAANRRASERAANHRSEP